MNQTLEECRWLYNRLLEERRLAWEAADASVSLYDQHKRLPMLKQERPSLDTVDGHRRLSRPTPYGDGRPAFLQRAKGTDRTRSWQDAALGGKVIAR